MKRVFLAAFIGLTFFLCAHKPASALVEFCPAALEYQAVGQSEDYTGPATLYGFELTALGARTITSATLALDTSEGWYTLSVPQLAIVAKDRHYTGPTNRFVRRDFVSPVMYAQFSRAVIVAHAWVFTVAAQNDGEFGWQTLGTVSCDPSPAAAPDQSRRRRPLRHQGYLLDPSDADRLSAPPAPGALVMAPNVSKALESSACPEPFREATVKVLNYPRLPPAMRDFLSGPATTSVEVAIDSNGTLRDAWTWGPSGYRQLDTEAIRAARNSAYVGARAYCRSVPGTYQFRVTFNP